MMDLRFAHSLGDKYESRSQSARVLSERWAEINLYCPNCGYNPLQRYKNNRPVADFLCLHCSEEYELKSNRGPFSKRVPDGAYHTMMSRLVEANNPNLILLSYTLDSLHVSDVVALPRHFFVPAMIEKRSPLKATARRAGWTGCNILLHDVPSAGLISVVHNSAICDPVAVQSNWNSTRFLSEQGDLGARGWLLTTIKCIERIGRPAFTLSEVYSHESWVSARYPGNHHIRAKLRQQLQRLRDAGYLEFEGAGRYRVVAPLS